MNNSSNSRLIFPQKSKSVDRVSEQELRQMFIEIFNSSQNHQYLYSVETPTKFIYSFADKQNPKVSKENNNKEHYKSANIDMVIHSPMGKRIAIIEFKAHNPSLGEYKKDMCKLLNEPGVAMRYFIQLINSGTTAETLTSKYNRAINQNSDNLFIYVLNIKSKVLYKMVNQKFCCINE